jgi:hypothetical protein
MIRSLKSISAAAMLLVTTLVFTGCEGAFDDIFGEWDRPAKTDSSTSTNKVGSITFVTSNVSKHFLDDNFTNDFPGLATFKIFKFCILGQKVW